MNLSGGDEIWVIAGQKNLPDMEVMEKKWYCSLKYGKYVSYATRSTDAKQASFTLPSLPLESHLNLELANLISLDFNTNDPENQ